MIVFAGAVAVAAAESELEPGKTDSRRLEIPPMIPPPPAVEVGEGNGVEEGSLGVSDEEAEGESVEVTS